MYPESTRLKILIICSPKQDKCFIREALRNSDYEIFEAQNSKVGIQKAVEYTPDLVICQNDMDGYNGFQVYNLLKDTLNNEGILFFIYSDDFDKEDILIGLEMGVDNFIVSPVDEKALVEKIEQQVRKVKKRKLDASQKLKAHIEATPVPKFIVVNHCIKHANEAFYRLLQVPNERRDDLSVDDVFNLGENAENARNYKKCMNGFIEHCRLNGVSSNFILNGFFDVYLSYSSDNGQGTLYAEVSVAAGNLNGKNRNGRARQNMIATESNRSNFQLTPREKQVLEYSHCGFPVKTIAERLELSVRTVEKHRANIMRKTNSNSMIEAIYSINNHSFQKQKTTV